MLTISEQNVICMTSSQDIDDRTKGLPISRNVKSKARKIFWTKEGVRVTEFCDFNSTEILECYFQMNGPLDSDEEDDEEDLLPNISIVNSRNRPTPNLFNTTRQAAPSFVPPRTAVPAFVSNRIPVTTTNSAVVNVSTSTPDAGSEFGDDDEDDFFRALDDIGLLSSSDLDKTFE